MTWPNLMFLICAVFVLVFIRIWWVAITINRARDYVDATRGDQYIDAAIWYNRIAVGRMIIRFWRSPCAFLEEPHRSSFISWRRRQ